jgi:DNA invertase Pin-like site-specific DNA recombinase
MSTVGYTRISDDREGDAKGVGRQRSDIQTKATALSWGEVSEFYEDNDITADPKKKPRPAFDRLLADMTAGKVKRVLCYDQDRLVRDMRQLEDVVDAVEAGGVALTSVNGDIDLTTDNGRMVARIKGAVAKGELEKIARRVSDKIRHDAVAGIKKQGRFRTFGYNRDMTPHPTEAPLVVEAFTRKAAGESLTAIADDFTQRGTTTTGGGLFDASALTKVIRRTDYKGVISLNGAEVGPAAFKALVDTAVWTAANDAAVPRRGANTRVSLLSGFLVCGNCLTKMKRGGNRDGHAYRCPGPKAVAGSCGSCSIGGADLDLAVFNAAWQHEQRQGPVKPKTPQRDYKAEVQALEDEIVAVRESSLTVADKVPMLTDLRAALTKLQKEEAKAAPKDFGRMRSVMDWSQANLSQKKMWLSQHVSYVEIAKADRIGIKGFKPQRVTIHYTNGEVLQLGPVDPSFNYVKPLNKVDITSVGNSGGWKIEGPGDDDLTEEEKAEREPRRQRILKAIQKRNQEKGSASVD